MDEFGRALGRRLRLGSAASLEHIGRGESVARARRVGVERVGRDVNEPVLRDQHTAARPERDNDLQDTEGFRAVCQQGLEMGFDGKTLIHPGQIEPCNEIFAPSSSELEMAGKIVTAFKAAQAEGKGVVTVDGRMIENLHVEQAERALALAAAIKELQAA